MEYMISKSNNKQFKCRFKNCKNRPTRCKNYIFYCLHHFNKYYKNVYIKYNTRTKK